MSHEPKKQFDLSKTIPKMCSEIALLDPGSLARLRRMDPLGPGEAEFWKLAVSHHYRTDQVGIMLIKLLAILTPKGQPGKKVLHIPQMPLGKLLARIENSRPLLSETRLLRFIALPFEKRPEALERICFLIAAKGHDGLDCVGLAKLLFYPEVNHTRILARAYFSSLNSELKDTSNKKEDIT